MDYIQTKGIAIRRVDDSIFLVNPDNDALYQLDGVGSVLWLALAVPMDVAAAVRLILTVFPEADGDTVRRDVKVLLHDLADHRLISGVGS